MTEYVPDAPAGWYDVPAGGKRYWNGRDWTADVLGAPSREAEYAALAPYLPPPTAIVAPSQPPGWYPGPLGQLQWWDGRAWGAVSPSPVIAATRKEVGVAYIFILLLGGFSAHRFYLGRIGSAIAFNAIWWVGWALSAFLIGIPLVIAGMIWIIVDLFLIPSMVRETNAARGYPW